MRPRAALFDLDGTLLDTLDDLTAATNAALTACGRPTRTRDEVRRFVGHGARRLIERALPAGADEAEVGRALDAFRAAYVPRNMTAKPYDGVVALVGALQAAGVGVAVVSNKPEEAARALVRRWFPAVKVVLGGNGERPLKPAPDAFREAADRLGADARTCVCVGDSAVDLETARAFGIPCIAVGWGFCGREALLSAGAAIVVDTAEELCTLLLGKQATTRG